MAGYKPLKIAGNQTGLVEQREEFLLPDDGYPTLYNAFIFREQLKRKQGFDLINRFRRVIVNQTIGNTLASPWTFNIFASIGLKGNITGITNANPGVVTSPNHNLISGQQIIITNVSGMTEVNDLTFVVTVITPDTFSIGVDTSAFGVYTSGGLWSLLNEQYAEIDCGSVVITINAAPPIVFTDDGSGNLTSPTVGNSGTINYITGSVTLTHTAAVGIATTASFNYFPTLPVMGLRDRDLNNINAEQCVGFDTKYAYTSNGVTWAEFIPGFTWSGNNSDFFWTTNYWVTPAPANKKLFWATNFSQNDPIRYTDDSTWIDFAPTIDAAGNRLQKCQAMLPFRGRLVVFNTYEGMALVGSTQFRQRIRWAAIGNPIADISALFPLVTDTQPNAWRDDIRGKGGFLDIPTAEDIISVGFVRDNLVIYCERSTWQLKYNGRSISPFQIEKVNSELGAESTFSIIQFDTSLDGIGDKGIVTCDSFQSRRFDIKIPDFVFQINNDENGTKRVYGVRDFVQRLAYWTYPYKPLDDEPLSPSIFPNRRLVYNYENDSWAIFSDSYTAFGTFQPQTSLRWQDVQEPWQDLNSPWVSRPSALPAIVGGNQQGYVGYLGSNIGGTVKNDISLTIQGISGNSPNVTTIYSPYHNLQTSDVIEIIGIPLGTGYAASLNNPQSGLITAATQADPCVITSANHGLETGDTIAIINVVGMVELNNNQYRVTVLTPNTFYLQEPVAPFTNINSTAFGAYVSDGQWTSLGSNVFSVVRLDEFNFELWKYDSLTDDFNTPQVNLPETYIGCGQILVRDNFSIVSKKFNNLDEGQSIQLGYIDVLCDTTSQGQITLNTYANYNDSQPTNKLPQNVIQSTQQPDTFFNATLPTSSNVFLVPNSSKNWHRIFCATRANFITIEWTLSNAQMISSAQESDVRIDAQILWMRPAGRLSF